MLYNFIINGKLLLPRPPYRFVCQFPLWWHSKDSWRKVHTMHELGATLLPADSDYWVCFQVPPNIASGSPACVLQVHYIGLFTFPKTAIHITTCVYHCPHSLNNYNKQSKGCC